MGGILERLESIEGPLVIQKLPFQLFQSLCGSTHIAVCVRGSKDPGPYPPNPDAKQEVDSPFKQERALMGNIVKKVASRLQEEDNP